MKKKNRGHLTLEERQEIYVMRESGKGFSEIGRVVLRDRSVIKRELQRNSGRIPLWSRLSGLEKAKLAHERAGVRQRTSKKSRRKRMDAWEVSQRISALLRETHFSPEYIALIISQSDLGVRVSGKTIRRWIKRNSPDLQKECPHRAKRRRAHLTPRRRRRREAAERKRSIHQRSEIIDNRERAGDFEADTVVCSQSTNSILAVQDRKTRRIWLRKVENLQSATVRIALFGIFGTVPPQLLHSLTLDNGTEFADTLTLERHFNLDTYACDPYCAWQKGSVENLNKAIRRFIPKGTDLSTISTDFLQLIEQILNSRPMECLQTVTPLDAWFFESRKAQLFMH